MGFVNSLLGGESGNQGGAGIRYRADSANIVSPTTTEQADTAYAQSQAAIAQQQQLLGQLQSQGGIGNQNAVYGHLGDIAAGRGPNPAQAMLNQATGQNVSDQAALMASQRGASQNPALIARLAAQQGAQAQQQAAGQAATMQAQQSMNALNSMGNLANQQVAQQVNATTGLNQMNQSEQQTLLNSIQGVNNARVGSTSSQNSANSGVAAGVAGQQGSLLGGVIGGAAHAFGLAHGGMVPRYASGGETQPIMPGPPLSGGSGGPQSFVGQFLSNNTSGGNYQLAGTQFSDHSAADKKTQDSASEGSEAFTQGAKDYFNKPPSGQMAGGAADVDYSAMTTMMAAKGGPVKQQAPAFVGRDMPMQNFSVPMMADGGSPMSGLMSMLPMLAMLAAKGGQVNGENLGAKVVPGKAKVKGDSLTNDTVPAMLSPGEVVIPRHVMESKNPAKGAASFVQSVLNKKKAKR